jgi:hypothetical protein
METIAGLLSRAVLEGDWTRRTVWTQTILTERRWNGDGMETWRIMWIGLNVLDFRFKVNDKTASDYRKTKPVRYMAPTFKSFWHTQWIRLIWNPRMAKAIPLDQEVTTDIARRLADVCVFLNSHSALHKLHTVQSEDNFESWISNNAKRSGLGIF